MTYNNINIQHKPQVSKQSKKTWRVYKSQGVLHLYTTLLGSVSQSDSVKLITHVIEEISMGICRS
jgi:hypothetical protein